MSPAPGIESAAEDSPLLREALEMARAAHAGQVRTGSGGRAYIEHPMAVAEELLQVGFPEEVLAAALLHDVVEDSEAEREDIEERTGARVAELVEALTDDESIEDRAARKREHRERISRADQEAMAIYAADKLTNVRMLCDAWEAQGDSVAGELRAPLGEKVESWSGDLEMLRTEAASEAVETLAGRLDAELSRLQGLRGTTAPPARP